MDLKVMTLNLLYAGATNPTGSWSARLPLVVSTLHSGADIITLQEATVSQIHDLQAALPDFTLVTGPESGPTRLPRVLNRGPRQGEHCVILYRTVRFEALELSAFWLSHRPHIPGSILVGTWLPRAVNWVRLLQCALGLSPLGSPTLRTDLAPDAGSLLGQQPPAPDGRLQRLASLQGLCAPGHSA